MKALPTFIFGGSATIGTMAAGFKVKDVVEMTDDMEKHNAYHFVRNYPDINLIKASDSWNKDPDELREVLLNLNDGRDYDYVFTNPPCSSLSLINRHASADGPNNVYFKHSAKVIMASGTRTFTLENAPTLISIGMPVLYDFMKRLVGQYRFTVVRDFAKNHNVPMTRQRTMVFGWNRKEFSGVPQIFMKKTETPSIRDTIGDIINTQSNVPNHSYSLYNTQVEPWEYEVIGKLIEYIKPTPGQNMTTLNGMIHALDSPVGTWLEENYPKAHALVSRKKEFLAKKVAMGTGIWDKSPSITHWDKTGPSMTQMTRAIHPDGKRFFTIREYARMMGYPDDFVFYEGGSTPPIQCMAQGVPVNFVKWAAEECKRNMIETPTYLTDSDIVFQHHGQECWDEYDLEELNGMEKLEPSNNSKKLVDVNPSKENYEFFT